MWVFLLTEILFFGALFMVYTIYRMWYPGAFAAASHHLDIPLGTINTAVLIGSSLTMALAVHAAQLNSRKGIMVFHRADDDPRQRVPWHQRRSSTRTSFTSISFRARSSRSRPQFARPAQIFFSLYFMMTGLHALHMIVGMGLMIWMLRLGLQRHARRRVLLSRRNRRSLLALRRHRLDFPVSAALPDRAARVGTHMAEHAHDQHHVVPAEDLLRDLRAS